MSHPFITTFCQYINLAPSALKSYVEHLERYKIPCRQTELDASLIAMQRSGWLQHQSGNFALIHPLLHFQAPKQYFLEFKEQEEKTKIALGDFYEDYAEEIYKRLLEGGTEQTYLEGIAYMKREYSNIWRFLMQKISDPQPPFFLYACLINFANHQLAPPHILQLIIRLTEKMRQAYQHNLNNSQLQFKGSLLHELGKAYLRSLRTNDAEIVLQEALLVFQQLHDYNGQAYVEHTLGNFDYKELKYKKALTYFRNSFRHYRQAGKVVEAADVRLNIAAIYRLQRKFRPAEQINQAILKFFDQSRLTAKKALVLENLGELRLDLHQYHSAIEYFEMALQIHTQYDDLRSVAKMQRYLGDAYDGLSNYKLCKTHYYHNIEILLRLPSVEDNLLEKSYNRLGIAAFNLEEWEDAKTYFQKALELQTSPEGIGTQHMNLGSVSLKLGDPSKAIYYFEQAIGYFKNSSRSLTLGKLMQNMGICFFMSDKYTEAQPYLEQAIGIYKEINENFHLAEVQEYLGYTYHYLNQPEKSRQHLEAAATGLLQSNRLDYFQHLLKNTEEMEGFIDLEEFKKKFETKTVLS